MKSKTTTAWLAFLGGPLGLHRFYLRGLGDWLGWLLPFHLSLSILPNLHTSESHEADIYLLYEAID